MHTDPSSLRRACRRPIAALPITALLCAAGLAQQPAPEKALPAAMRTSLAKVFDPFDECPVARVSPAADDPAVVAWAAEQLAARAPDRARAVLDLRAALRRLAADPSEDARRAVVHVLHALRELDAEVPAAELLLPVAAEAEIVRVHLLLRAASATGGELLQTFQQLDPARELSWEAVGGALATRGHRTFAAELHAGLRPVLHVIVGEHRALRTPVRVIRPLTTPLPDPSGFPPLPEYRWFRDERGLLELRCERAGSHRAQIASATGVDPVLVDCARLRWLAMLAGASDPVRDSQRCVIVVAERELAALDARIAAGTQRLVETLTAIDDGLRRKGMLPPALPRRLPPPAVAVTDCRHESRQTARPLPSRK